MKYWLKLVQGSYSYGCFDIEQEKGQILALFIFKERKKHVYNC